MNLFRTKLPLSSQGKIGDGWRSLGLEGAFKSPASNGIRSILFSSISHVALFSFAGDVLFCWVVFYYCLGRLSPPFVEGLDSPYDQLSK